MRPLILSENSDRYCESARAFSLAELLIVIAVTTIVGAASYPVINNLSGASSYAEANAKAEALTAAKIQFRKSDPSADTDWNAAATDSAKFQQLRPFLKGAPAELTLAEYSAETPYNQFNFGTKLRDRVTVNRTD